MSLRYDANLETEREVFVDKRSLLRPTLSAEHHRIHDGEMFTCSNKMDITAAKIGAIQITVPAGSIAHFKAVGISVTGGPVIANLLEDYTFVGGSVLPAFNRNRASTKTTPLVLKGLADATAVAGASPISLDMLVIAGASQGALQIGANGSTDEEIMLKPGNYILTFSNTSVGTVTVGYTLNWYT